MKIFPVIANNCYDKEFHIPQALMRTYVRSLQGGVSYALNDKANIDISYKFQDFGKMKAFDKQKLTVGNWRDCEVKSDSKIKTHTVSFGLRYKI
jgi:hypothetical protein